MRSGMPWSGNAAARFTVVDLAVVQATEVKEASPEELIALAEEMGLDLRQFEIQER